MNQELPIPTSLRRDWRLLSASEAKFQAYSVESYFRTSWHDIEEVLAANVFEQLHNLVLVVFRPDAIIGRKVFAALRLLSYYELVPVAARSIRLSRLSIHELWRYQWNAASLDRIALSERLFTYSDSLLVILRRTSHARIPASVLLARGKGSPQVTERKATDLRSILGSPNRMLTFLHIADEPLDLVRELGILFPRSERIALMMESDMPIDRRDTNAIQAIVRDMYTKAGRLELDPSKALAHLLCSALSKSQHHQSHDVQIALRALISDLHKAKSGSKLSWRRIEQNADIVGLANEWNLLMVGSEYIEHDIEAQSAIIDGDTSIRDWS